MTTPDNKVIILPNGNLANTSLTNVTSAEIRRLDIPVGISYDSDIKTARAVLEAMMKEEPKTLKDKEMMVVVDNLGASSIELGIRCYVKCEDYWDVKWRLTEQCKYVLDEAGITIPFTQVDVHIDR